MSDEDSITGHGIYLAGNFEIEEKITPELTQRESQYRTYILSIPCNGANHNRSFSYEIKAIGYSGKNVKLTAKTSDRGIVTNGEGFPHSLVDTVGMTALGRVLKKTEIVEDSIQHLIPKNPSKDKVTTIVTVEHSDYHPETKLPKTSQIEYRIRPFPHLAGTYKVIKVGRECLFHGYIKDFNEQTNCYVVIVNRVSTTSGHIDESEMSTTTGNKATTSGNTSSQVNPHKPVKFNPRAVNSAFKSPLVTSDSQASIPFGPSDFTETSFSSASSKSNASPSKNKASDESYEEDTPALTKKNKSKVTPKPKSPVAAPPAKRPRAPRARRSAMNDKVLDIASEG
ncbi:uncharacterized protein MELLADRAFT_93089 [Melampsora larici-populina 98AG31]|uniref:Uncharacterized protein n=1 Tax=Melampsora larici-populina (strain 98AG31 / pathotype 3-4-7) TaxID=747676 RepID=F4S3W9_MELLP|nr:uncharacterized protein MELLADRAFT_93089 [Melampsora larici-populina 98AG31]EGG00667.1 hypothetical protein MELLADRAFT_93089 [Melampsora larici-populina 98AG31]